jgi:two-component system nitrogen regulation response regulator NtrX
MSSVLVADDSEVMRRAICTQLIANGIENVSEAVDGFEAIAKTLTTDPDLVILDIAMVRLNGIDTLKELRKLRPNLPVIVHTQYAEALHKVRGVSKGPTQVVAKGNPLLPVVLSLIASTVSRHQSH